MNRWLISWDDIGLDGLVNLSELEQQFVFDSLRYGPRRDPRWDVERNMILRATANHHRNYEIWEIAADPDLTEADLKRWFSEDPESIKGSMRSNGIKIW